LGRYTGRAEEAQMSLLENRILGAVDRDTVFTLNHQRKSEIYSSDKEYFDSLQNVIYSGTDGFVVEME
jgi:hypothetical protein